MDTQDPAAITRAELDWVCVTQRAADNDPHSQLLWVQAALAISDVIMVCNVLAIDEAHAAHAQHLVNRLAILACDRGTQAVALASERIKDVLEAIGRGERLDMRALL
jgi:hypothetical protein